MKVLALLPLLLVLAACGHAGDPDTEAPHADPSARFYSGCARPGEFLSPADLPAIPPSFDEAVR